MDIDEKKQKEDEARVAEEYLSSLSDLNCNSKPLINMLTMLADENINFAPVIVNVVQNHIAKVSPDIKLPILYLIDSIIKNVKSTYVQLFSQCIVNIFCGAFETVNEKVRERMYALRQTWNEVFSPAKLYALDIKVKRLDNNWPITAKPAPQTAIHVNPKFLAQGLQLEAAGAGAAVEMEDKLKEKTRELLELKKLKLELELEATKKFLQEQEQQLNSKTEGVVPVTLPNNTAAAAGGAIAPVTANAAIVPIVPNAANIAPNASVQMLPNAGTALQNAVGGATQMRPTGMYNPNFRHARPQGYGQVPAGMQQQAGFGMNMAVNSNKTKVNPVNPALLNSFRHRDPRLARKQQQQQQQQQPQFPQNQERFGQNMHNADAGKVIDIDANDTAYRGNSRSHDAASRGSKSPSRHNSASNHHRNAGRSGKNSNSRDRERDSDREKERDRERERERDRDRRRRNDGKSTSSSERRKADSSSASRSDLNKKSHHPNNNDYKDNETISTAYKRKSSSPAGSISPTKGKDNRRPGKSSRHYSSSSSRNKHHSRSPSPARSSRARSNSSSSDVRKHSKSKSPPPPLTGSTLASLAAPEKRRKLSVSEELEAAAATKKDETAKSVTTAAFSNVAGVGVTGATDLEKRAISTATSKLIQPKPTTVMDIDLRQLLFAPPILSNKSSNVTGASTTTSAIKQLLPDVFVVSDDDDDAAVIVDNSADNLFPPNASICSSKNVKNLLQKTSTSSSTIKTTSSSIITNTNTATTTTTTTMTTTTTNIPKVSFKIQKKSFNKLEKSTENLSTASTTTNTATTAAISASSSHATQPKRISKRRESKFDDNNGSMPNGEEESKKRIATIKETDEENDNDIIEIDEPVAKKPKQSAKIDELFGTEDVDLRTEMLIPPPPTLTADERNVQNWDHLKAKVVSPEKQPSNVKKSSSLDDVRAKLAKAAKFNKQGKYDISKASKLDNMSQRLNKLADMNINEEALEANDEKIRTIISQAQEMLEANNIDNEQYKNLVETVMCINESNKLKVAKRRESLTAQKSGAVVDEERSTDAERLAARDAVLKKRIPKLPKKGNASPTSDGNNATKSPLYEDKPDDEQQHKSQPAPKPQRERRNKPSKWGDRIGDTAATGQALNHNQQQQMLQQRQWMLNMNAGGNNNKRGGMSQQQMNAVPANFRATSVPNPPVPPPSLLNNAAVMHMGGAAPSAWQGAGNNNAMMPFMQNNAAGVNISGVTVPPPPQPPAMLNLPPKPCNSIDNPKADMVRTITIDGAAKEIRIYDSIAIVFMELDTPREIGFQPGTRCIYIDNQDAIPLHFNDDYKPFMIDGTMHRFRFGFPSRELYIDEQWYEIYFGGPPVSIPIGNRVHIIKAEGPPPQVNIGPIRRDLVAGKIGMIVDALMVVSLFLDARIQTFKVGDTEHTVQFADNFLTVLLDGEPYKAEYGQLPKSYKLSGKKYFIRFNSLPKGVEPGKIVIKDMIYVHHKPPAELPAAEALPLTTVPMSTEESTAGTVAVAPVAPAQLPTAALKNINIDELFQKLVSSGILSSALPVATPVVTTNATPTETETNAADSNTATNPDTSKTAVASASDNKAGSAAANAEAQPQKALEPIIPINLAKSESIKTRQPAIIATLYTGMQCSSCGVRFPLEQTIKYSQHLDWHFRQNRRERDASRKAHFRKWYYELSDWVQYEEIEDLDEREKNFFEAQQSGADMDAFDDVSNQRSTNSPVPSCPAGPDDVDRKCDMCHEKFEQFYNEELEEWHLRSAKRVEDKIYHPLCYEDYKASLNAPLVEEKPKDESLITDDDNAVDIEIKKEDDSAVAQPIDITSVTINDDDDDDDDVIVLPNEEPSVTEIVDDDEDEYVPANVTREEMGNNKEDLPKDDATKTVENDEVASDATEQPPAAEQATPAEATTAEATPAANPNESLDADVVIQEPLIPFTDLDTYVEKELPEMDENSQLSFLNVKIKEEPKDDDEDEDDGFEDVGTVLIQPDEEISLHSSETQTQTIISLNSANSPQSLLERPESAASQHNDNNVDADVNASKAADDNLATTKTSTVEVEAKDGTETADAAAAETTETTATPPTTTTTTSTANTEGNDTITTTTAIASNFSNSLNADFESESAEHNLSAAGPAPLPMPLANLVNKIKINITKNSNSSHSNNHNSNNNSSNGVQQATTITTGTINSSTTTPAVHSNISHISSLGSTIPVLCSSGSTMSKFSTTNNVPAAAAIHPAHISTHTAASSSMSAMAQRHQQTTSNTHQQAAAPPSNVSSISVIGSSYGSSTVGSHHHAMLSSMMRIQPNVIKPIQPQQPTVTATPVASAISTSTLTAIRPAKTPTPPSVEDTISYELKPTLKSVQLKKMKKIERGVETSGLCSIM